MSEPVIVRRGGEADLDAVARIQAASPEASAWPVRDYLAYDLLVAESGASVAGFAVARRVADDESELLNLAVEPAYRRRGIARELVTRLTASYRGTLWLEVRESNLAARKLYDSIGFKIVAQRPLYYSRSCESAIVMNIHSW